MVHEWAIYFVATSQGHQKVLASSLEAMNSAVTFIALLGRKNLFELFLVSKSDPSSVVSYSTGEI